MPDLTVLLRIEPERASDRGQQRLAAGAADGADRFEGEGIELQRVVAEAYDEIAAREPDRVDGDRRGGHGRRGARPGAGRGRGREAMSAAPVTLPEATEHQPAARIALEAASSSPITPTC